MVYYEPAMTPDYVRIARLMTQTEGAQFTRSNDVGSTIVGYGATRDPTDSVPRIGRLIRGATEPKMFAVMPRPVKCNRHVPQCTPSGTTPGCLLEVEVQLLDIAETKDTCNGDSGGPLFMDNGDSAAQQVLAAVTSRAMSPPRKSCGSGGIYTSVFSEEAIAWLKTVMQTEP
jgi:Trypsin